MDKAITTHYRYIQIHPDVDMAWQLGLLSAMKDPSQVLIKSHLAVVIKDKYPKAKHHYLVLPLEHIPSIFKVS